MAKDFDEIFDTAIEAARISVHGVSAFTALENVRETLVANGHDSVERVWVSRQQGIDDRRQAQAAWQAAMLGFAAGKLVRIQEECRAAQQNGQTIPEDLWAVLDRILSIATEARPSESSSPM